MGLGYEGQKGDKGQKGEIGPVGSPAILPQTGGGNTIGPQGEPGLPGEQGEKGNHGLKGEPGPSGDLGMPGMDGGKGEKGLPGAPGPRVSKGFKSNSQHIKLYATKCSKMYIICCRVEMVLPDRLVLPDKKEIVVTMVYRVCQADLV